MVAVRTSIDPLPCVLIIDEAALIRSGLQQLLADHIRTVRVVEAKNAREAAGRLAQRRWDMIVLGLDIFAKEGSALLRQARRDNPETRVLILNSSEDPEAALRARELGASGLIGKEAERADLIAALKAILKGSQYFVRSARQGQTRQPRLSAREYSVLLGVVAGRSVTEMARELEVNVKTVSTYKRRLMVKLGLRSTVDIVRYALERRLG